MVLVEVRSEVDPTDAAKLVHGHQPFVHGRFAGCAASASRIWVLFRLSGMGRGKGKRGADPHECLHATTDLSASAAEDDASETSDSSADAAPLWLSLPD